MRRLLPCLCLALFCGSAAFAQDRDYPKFDFTAAYTFNHLETPAPTTRQNLQGFTLAAAANFRKHVAVEADVTYTTKTTLGVKRYLISYMVGPRYTWRKENSNLQPFVHALIGGGQLGGFPRTVGGRPIVTDGWTGKFGGGLDVIAAKHIAIRVGQVDYYRYHGHIPGGSQRLDNIAFTFGIRFF
ncbi:MAG TPA: outer membrane beta-barrel protein [Pyrinomonadaceae bacterium]